MRRHSCSRSVIATPNGSGDATRREEPQRCGTAMWAAYRTAPSLRNFASECCNWRENYSGEAHKRFEPTLAVEHLRKDHDLQVSVRTLRRWMLAAGLWSRRRKRKPHRSRRQRKAHFGELIQVDGSHHDWLEGRGLQGCLMNFVDDAIGVALCRFSSEETTWAAADLLEAWVRQYGVPKALYCDWKNVYLRQPTSWEAIEGIEPVTQRRSSDACAPSWELLSSPLRRRKPRAAWSDMTARIKTA